MTEELKREEAKMLKKIRQISLAITDELILLSAFTQDNNYFAKTIKAVNARLAQLVPPEVPLEELLKPDEEEADDDNENPLPYVDSITQQLMGIMED